MLLNIYKEPHWTSFDVVAKLRGLFKTKKVGHAGTLDPLAEGVLIVLTDKDTKKQAKIMKMPKEYVAQIAFGAHSPTYDLEGPLTFTKIADPKKLFEDIKNLLPKYIGKIKQTVPPFSAKKVAGKPLYKKARSGAIDLKSLPQKDVEIFDIKIQNFTQKEITRGVVLPVLTCTIMCGSGTYVRSIAHDLGQDLGVGGVLVHLVRTRVGGFMVEDSKKIAAVEANKALFAS